MSPRVYFMRRPYHRARQRDTVEQLPAPFTAIAPELPPVPDHEANARRSASPLAKVGTAYAQGPLPLNVGRVLDGRVREANLLYTWGKLPIARGGPPFVVELDNPYVLTLYRPAALRRARSVLRRILLSPRCAGIVCISDACRRSLAATLGADVAARARVVHPYAPVVPVATPGAGEGLEVVLVGTQFFLKGGRELCAAFARVARDLPGVRLTVVTRVRPEVAARVRHPSIRLVGAMPREEVRALLSRADLLVLPSVVESYGMAVLEGLAAGLPVLATDVYAVHELVRDGVNGRLLPDPLGMWRDDVAVEDRWRLGDLDEYARRHPMPGHEGRIEGGLRELLADRAGLRAMGTASRELFRARFAPPVRAARMREALTAFGA